jgi:hypothetical protein
MPVPLSPTPTCACGPSADNPRQCGTPGLLTGSNVPLTETILVEPVLADGPGNGKSPLTAPAFQQFHLIVATVTSIHDLDTPAPGLPVRQIALSIQNSCAKNAKSCVYYNRGTVRGSMRGSAPTPLLKPTLSPLDRVSAWHRASNSASRLKRRMHPARFQGA